MRYRRNSDDSHFYIWNEGNNAFLFGPSYSRLNVSYHSVGGAEDGNTDRVVQDADQRLPGTWCLRDHPYGVCSGTCLKCRNSFHQAGQRPASHVMQKWVEREGEEGEGERGQSFAHRVGGGCRRDLCFGRRVVRGLVLVFELVDLFRQVPCFSAGATFLLRGFILCSVLEFRRARTTLVRRMDPFFPEFLCGAACPRRIFIPREDDGAIEFWR